MFGSSLFIVCLFGYGFGFVCIWVFKCLFGICGCIDIIGNDKFVDFWKYVSVVFIVVVYLWILMFKF